MAVTLSGDGLPVGQRLPAVLAAGTGIVMSVLDGNIANVALPTIARELHATPAASVWVINAFQVAVAALIIPLAALGDSWGYSRVYRVGLAVFTVGSLLCAVSHDLALLIAARALQGIGAAWILSCAQVIFRSIFPRAMLGRAIGYVGLTVAVSTAAGPTIGGLILAFAPWPWLFLINVPLGICALAGSFRALPRRDQPTRPFDFVGAALVAPVFVLAFLALDSIAQGGNALLATFQFLAGLTIGAAFVVRSLRMTHPLIDPRLFTIARISMSAGVGFTSFTAQGLAFIAMPFLIQSVMGRSAFESGLLFTTWPLATAVAVPLAGHLTDRYDAGILGTIGMATLTAGLASFALLPPDPSSFDILWRGAICGAGFGFYQAPNNHAILTSLPRTSSGSGAAVISITRLCGQSTGAALAAIVLAASGATLHAHGIPALRGAVTRAFELATALTGAGIFVSALRLRSPRLS